MLGFLSAFSHPLQFGFCLHLSIRIAFSEFTHDLLTLRFAGYFPLILYLDCMTQLTWLISPPSLLSTPLALLSLNSPDVACMFSISALSCFSPLKSSSESKMKVVQSCPTLCDPMGYAVHGILWARILEWAAFPFSRGSPQPRDWTPVSRIAGRFFTSWARREALKSWGPPK